MPGTRLRYLRSAARVRCRVVPVPGRHRDCHRADRGTGGGLANRLHRGYRPGGCRRPTAPSPDRHRSGPQHHPGHRAGFVWVAQVRIPDRPTRRPVDGFERPGESPGQSRDAGQKRRCGVEAGPVQHGNAPPPARTPRSWWWAVRGRYRQEAHDHCDCAPAGTIRAVRCSDNRRTELVRSHMDTLRVGACGGREGAAWPDLGGVKDVRIRPAGSLRDGLDQLPSTVPQQGGCNGVDTASWLVSLLCVSRRVLPSRGACACACRQRPSVGPAVAYPAIGLKSKRGSPPARGRPDMADESAWAWYFACARRHPAMLGAAESPAGSGRALARLPALARFAPRPLVLNLADQVSTHLREGMIEVALAGGGHEVRSFR
jgi:hypothetical protein